MWTTLAQGGQVTATGFTPAQFTLNTGQQYVVTVSDYGSILFDHWQDTGSTNPSRTISISQATTLTAVYRTGGASNSPPVANSQSVSVNENSAVSFTLTGSDPNGQPIQFFVASQPQHGTLGMVNPSTGAVTYTPYDYYDGPDSFTFVTNDGSVDSAPATVSISVANTATRTTSRAVVITTDLNGHTASGMYTTISQGGLQLDQGYSQIDFGVNNGQQYTITVYSFDKFLFDHWQDTGSTNPSRTISISQDTGFIAMYRTAAITLSPSSGAQGTTVTVTGQGFASSSTVSLAYDGTALASTSPSTITTDAAGRFSATFTVPSWSSQGSNTVRATDQQGVVATATFTDTSVPPPTATLTVNSQLTGGGAISGFWTTLAQNGQVVATGFTPAQFTLNTSQQYVVTVSDYGQWRFDHWLDNGSTNPSRTVSISQATTLTAVYAVVP
jgi:hypothetical protein